MFIKYGVDANGALVYIDQVARGRTNLKCPYCGGQLLAHKGQMKFHHFAHVGETCRQAQRVDEEISPSLRQLQSTSATNVASCSTAIPQPNLPARLYPAQTASISHETRSTSHAGERHSCRLSYPIFSSLIRRLSLFAFDTAQRTLAGYETINMIRKGHVKGVDKGDIRAQIHLIHHLFGIAA